MSQELEIVLYGAAHCGFGWYALGVGLEGGILLREKKCFGEGGQQLAWSSMTAAVAAARMALKTAGAQVGAEVMVISPKGRRMKSTEVK
jgi:hypothetical protein